MSKLDNNGNHMIPLENQMKDKFLWIFSVKDVAWIALSIAVAVYLIGSLPIGEYKLSAQMLIVTLTTGSRIFIPDFGMSMGEFFGKIIKYLISPKKYRNIN